MSLSNYLKTACNSGSEKDIRAFYTEFLESEVFLVKLDKPVKFEDKDIVPCFSSLNAMSLWAEGREFSYAPVGARMLFVMLSEDTWSYLDPGSEFGKELSPWELRLLNKGEEAIEELVAYQCEKTDYYSDLDYGVGSAEELIAAAKVILESYREVDEAFFVWMDNKPVIGIDGEISNFLSDELKAHASALTLVPINSKLFEALFLESTPFYIRQHEHRSGKGSGNFKFWKSSSKRGD